MPHTIISTSEEKGYICVEPIYHSEGALINILENNGRDTMYDIEIRSQQNGDFTLVKKRNAAFNQDLGYSAIYRYAYTIDMLNPFYNSKVLNNFTLAGISKLSTHLNSDILTNFFSTKMPINVSLMNPNTFETTLLTSFNFTTLARRDQIFSFTISKHDRNGNVDYTTPEFFIMYRD